MSGRKATRLLHGKHIACDAFFALLSLCVVLTGDCLVGLDSLCISVCMIWHPGSVHTRRAVLVEQHWPVAFCSSGTVDVCVVSSVLLQG